MSVKRKRELLDRYGNSAFEPIDDYYMEKARGLSARYILFANKDNKHGYCEKCCKDVLFSHTKHNEEVECPNCKEKLTVMHTWRKKKCEWHMDWYVVGELVDKDTFLFRYIGVDQNTHFTKTVKELAREVYDFKHGWSYKLSHDYEDGWEINNYFFIEFNMYNRRKNCCIGAKAINDIKNRMKGLDAIKYFDKLSDYYGWYDYARDNALKLMNAPLYEKLEKVGLGNIALKDFHDYWHTIKWKRSETSLVKMLGINKAQFNILREHSSRENLLFIKENKDMPIETLKYIMANNCVNKYNGIKLYNLANTMKTLKYIVVNDINVYEYAHYISTLSNLGYSLTDESYVYPKDFRKADNRVTAEWNAKLDEERLKKMDKQSALIKKISDGLKKMPDLKQFMDGSNGLLVYVPDSAKDLLDEGRSQHNCIGSYVDRVANGKTLIFFVRKLNSPNEPFVAFEYCNGEVVQCRYDHNEAVKDDNIISFVDAFAERLRRNNVLCKAA